MDPSICSPACRSAGHPRVQIEGDPDPRKNLLIEKCGLFGCIANGEWPTNLGVANVVCLGLVGLQHRGQEAAGIVTGSGAHDHFNVNRGVGLVSQIFNEPIISGLKGNLGIGHTRYSTTGGTDNVQLAQPFIVHTSYGMIAVAHNGELLNSKNLRQKILDNGVGLSTGGDSELITQCLSMTPPDKYRNKLYRHPSGSDNRHVQYEQGIVVNPPSPNNSPKASRRTRTLTDPRERDEELLARLLHMMSLTPLSYSLIIQYQDCLYAIRDPFGNRPLCIGMLFTMPPDVGPRSSQEKLNIDGWVVSSESCSFPSVSAKLWRDIEPGEIVKLERNKLPKTLAIVPRPVADQAPAFCIFEYVYFARPDSVIEGQMVYSVRMECGRRLAREAGVQVPADNKTTHNMIVSPVPESSIPAALGFSEESGIPYVEAFSRNRYVGRTFIQPSVRLRRSGVSRKFGPLSANFQGKTIILIDDSIVRGTTIGQLIRLLKDCGAKEVHIRIASPPLHFPCYMGINIPTKEELIANHMTPAQLAESLGASSLVHLSVEGLKASVELGIKEKQASQGVKKEIGHCTACLTGEYPVSLDF